MVHSSSSCWWNVVEQATCSQLIPMLLSVYRVSRSVSRTPWYKVWPKRESKSESNKLVNMGRSLTWIDRKNDEWVNDEMSEILEMASWNDPKAWIPRNTEYHMRKHKRLLLRQSAECMCFAISWPVCFGFSAAPPLPKFRQ